MRHGNLLIRVFGLALRLVLTMALVSALLATTASNASAQVAENIDTNSYEIVGNGGVYSSMLIDANNRPVLAYIDTSVLRVHRCDDPGCVSGNHRSLELAGGTAQTALRLDATGRPVVAYFNTANGDYRVVQCENRHCGSTTVTSLFLSNPGSPLAPIGLALDEAGAPTIAVTDGDANS